MSLSDSEFRINWEIIDRYEGFSRRFGMKTYNAKVKCTYSTGNNEISIGNVIIQMEITLNSIIHRLLRAAKDDDYVRIAIRNQFLDYDIFTPFRRIQDFTNETILNEIIKVSQSKKEFLMSGMIEVDIIHVRVSGIGGGRKKYNLINVEKWRRNSKKLVQIARDGYCVPRSIIVSKAYEDGVKGLEWRRIRADLKKIQFKKAVELCEKAGVTVSETGVQFEDIGKFQNVLSPDYQLIIVKSPKSYYYIGPQAEKQLYLFMSENHCDSLLSIKAFLGCDHFCKKCLKGFTGKTSHCCDGICEYCYDTNQCTIESTLIKCKECNREFANNVCFSKHKEKTKICKKIWKCGNCSKILKTRVHQCGKYKCRICKVLVPFSGHHCFITPNDKNKIMKEDQLSKIFIFYDFESQQIPQKMNEYVHKPNLCVANVTCDACWDPISKDRKNSWCHFCGMKEYIFKGSNTVRDFNRFIFDTYASFVQEKKIYMKLKSDINIYVVAHNSRGYDCQFILKHCVDNRMTPSVIRKGTKILSMRIKNIKFIDSLSFLPMPLKKLPQTFGFESQIEKGMFPFYFNKPGNEHYIGEWPAIEYYDPNFMKEGEREKFLNWYEQQKHKEFNLDSEMLKYCKSDVDILLRCFMTFRQIFKSVSGIDPISRSITIAQSCMEVFKTNYLQPNQISIYPPNGYEPRRKISYIGSAWIDYIEYREKIAIKREIRIGRYYADGLNEESKTIYEFYGDLWHGCTLCYPTNRATIINPFNGLSVEYLYQQLTQKEDYLKNQGYQLITMWECKLKAMRKEDKSLDKFLTDHINHLKSKKFRPPLEPRDSFFGGRCNASKLYHCCDGDEKIYYMDFTSLYPFVVKRKKYPTGHPIRLTKNFDTNISNYDGFIFCKILPPQNLYFAVLPVRLRNRLVFPLCYKCAQLQSLEECNHSDNERCIVGTWTTMEIKKSLEKNYKVIEVYEIWHFPDLVPRNLNDKGLFTEFINAYIKLKVEASGWPRNDMTETEKEEYVKLYEEKENIKLNKDSIQCNAGMRALGKLVVVSFWGKFGQSCNLSKTQYIAEPQQFFKLLSDSTVSVTDALLISDETLQVTYEKEENYIESPAHASIIIASWVTSYARLELYELLDRLQERVLYFDTDSVIFYARPGDYVPDTGEFIGDLTNEIITHDEPDAHITKFASCGSKNYAYEVYYPNSGIRKYFCKVKGLSLNFITSNIVNFDAMKNLIDDAIRFQRKNRENDTDNEEEEEKPIILDVPQKIINVSPFLDLRTKEIKKKYRFVYDKRRIMPNNNNYTTVPFGYKISRPDMPSA
jgi:hypothetical protein